MIIGDNSNSSRSNDLNHSKHSSFDFFVDIMYLVNSSTVLRLKPKANNDRWVF